MNLIVLLVLAVLAAVQAQPHHRAHRHVPREVVKRAPNPAIAAVYVPGPVETVVVYELNGKPISEEDVRHGIANGTLVWDDDDNLSTSVPSVAIQTPEPSANHAKATEPEPQPGELPVTGHSSAFVVTPSSNPTLGVPEAPTPSQTAAPSNTSPGGSSCSDCEKEFPNGQLSCDEFPIGYGAIPLSQEGLGGWTGIQDPLQRGEGGFDDITTIPHGTCDDGTCCSRGRFCSYGCPNPYLKASFPKKQGKTKQSVGGLYCNQNGKLEMADGSLAKTLCMKGTEKATVRVQNKLKKSVSICRTDYPGTESMTIPFTVGPGETAEIAVPEESRYYFWDGKPTTGHYYVNNQGVPEDQACTWSDGHSAVGNWSPLIFGAGWDDINMQMGFFSLAQNPEQKEKLDYSIEFVGENDNVINPCKYIAKSGKICNPATNDCGEHTNGCTATLKKGLMTLVLSD